MEFIDLKSQYRRLKTEIDAGIQRVLDHGQYIMGPEVSELEAALSAHCGAAHSIACSSGTDALAMVLMAAQVRPGQAIFCPAFTFVATAEVVAWLGAHVWFVDVDADTFNMDPASLEVAIKSARDAGHAPVGVIPVDLFGIPADYDAISQIAAREGLWILGDGAQSYGARYHNRRVGTLATATATSPVKTRTGTSTPVSPVRTVNLLACSTSVSRPNSARTSPTACSATACGEYAGTRTTRRPSLAAAAKSTLLKPAHRKAMTRVP